MKNRMIVLLVLFLLLNAFSIISGCVSSSGRSSPSTSPTIETSKETGADLRYRLYGPAYVSSDYGGIDEAWTAVVNMTNVGNQAANGFCIKISLINNKTNVVEDARFIQSYCGKNCLTPGKFRNAGATFSPEPQEDGYYRVKGESCGGEWDPVTQID